VTVPNLRDERLCGLAVRDELRRRSRRTPGHVLSMAMIGLVGWFGNDTKHEHLSRRMEFYSLAVDSVARRLSAAERATLRATGQVPTWFLAEVCREYRAERRRGRR
jgi:hypothetical protein